MLSSSTCRPRSKLRLPPSSCIFPNKPKSRPMTVLDLPTYPFIHPPSRFIVGSWSTPGRQNGLFRREPSRSFGSLICHVLYICLHQPLSKSAALYSSSLSSISRAWAERWAWQYKPTSHARAVGVASACQIRSLHHRPPCRRSHSASLFAADRDHPWPIPVRVRLHGSSGRHTA
jgi:hypothetical protein